MASTNLSFECCRHCVAPKRHPGCRDKCKEYISVKSAIKEKKSVRWLGAGHRITFSLAFEKRKIETQSSVRMVVVFIVSATDKQGGYFYAQILHRCRR